MPNTKYASTQMGNWSSEVSAPQSAAGAAVKGPQTLQYPPAPMPADAPPALQFPPAPSRTLPASRSSVPAVCPAGHHPAHSEFTGSTGNLNLRHGQPDEVIESPTSTSEAYLGSLKAMLLQNRGNFVAATLLIGTQGTMVWEGILHEVGNDYFTIYQTGRQRYILCDIYALKYMEFYDTQQRELCERLLQENGTQGFS